MDSTGCSLPRNLSVGWHLSGAEDPATGGSPAVERGRTQWGGLPREGGGREAREVSQKQCPLPPFSPSESTKMETRAVSTGVLPASREDEQERDRPT